MFNNFQKGLARPLELNEHKEKYNTSLFLAVKFIVHVKL